MLLPTHAPAGTSAIRLIHGAADGLPHIYVDRLGERSVWVGCTCAAFARCALPAVVRAIDAALLPVEVLVSMPFDVADTVADGALGVGRSGDGGARDGSRRHGAGRRHPQLLTGLLSDARIGSAELPRWVARPVERVARRLSGKLWARSSRRA